MNPAKVQPVRTATIVATGDTDEGAGADTHVVGFEGGRDRIIAVPKRMTLNHLLLGDDGKAMFDRTMKTFMLTPIFLVMVREGSFTHAHRCQ